jgi:glycogen operon protein
VGSGGYQLGEFPERWGEWNDRSRDAIRQFWRGDQGSAGELARRLHGSADIFEISGRQPAASVNMVASHDGFTLADVVSYERKHNRANGEANRDGTSQNHSFNHGVEGPTTDPTILDLRRRQRLNLLATLFFSQGTPLLLAGDEFGNSQQGNNNAYAQDNPTGWLDWAGMAKDPRFTEQVRQLILLRRQNPLLRLEHFVHEAADRETDGVAFEWRDADGKALQSDDWAGLRSLIVFISECRGGTIESAVAILINGTRNEVPFRLDEGSSGAWKLAFSTSGDASLRGATVDMPAISMALAVADPTRAR